MAKATKKGKMGKRNRWIIGVVGVLILLFILIGVFGTPSAEMVFKDMNEKMLETKSVTIDQKLTMKGSASISSKLYVDMRSSTELLAKGNFSLDLTSDGSRMGFSGDLIKIGDSDFVRYSDVSSATPSLASSFSLINSKLKNNWIKIRDKDQYGSIAKTPIEFTVNILPVPFANLTGTQRKSVLEILQDKSMYTITESSKVETAGVSAYKYLLTYDKSQFKKAAKAIAGYVSYFKTSDDNTSDTVTSLTVWVDISTKQIIKFEYTGTTKTGDDVSGTISFSGYGQTQTIERPSDYSIESELLN